MWKSLAKKRSECSARHGHSHEAIGGRRRRGGWAARQRPGRQRRLHVQVDDRDAARDALVRRHGRIEGRASDVLGSLPGGLLRGHRLDRLRRVHVRAAAPSLGHAGPRRAEL